MKTAFVEYAIIIVELASHAYARPTWFPISLKPIIISYYIYRVHKGQPVLFPKI